MAFIVATLLRKALEKKPDALEPDSLWKSLMLEPWDYHLSERGVFHPLTRRLMEKIDFRHGGPEYDAKYPEGIPTSVVVRTKDGRELDSGLVMFPAGHARNSTARLEEILDHKFRLLGSLAVPEPERLDDLLQGLSSITRLDPHELGMLYEVEFAQRDDYE
jgi:2-methylcitrate dehydratase